MGYPSSLMGSHGWGVCVWGGSVLFPTIQNPSQAFHPDFLEKEQPGKGVDPIATMIFPSLIQHRSRIFKAGMLRSWICSIPATPSPPFSCWFHNTPVLLSHPLSLLPSCSYTAQRAPCRQGSPAPVQRYLGDARRFWLNPIAPVWSIWVGNQAKPGPGGPESSSTWGGGSECRERRAMGGGSLSHKS